MRRIQGFEFNERPECPRVLRESIVDILGTGLRWGRICEAVGPAFAEFCDRADCATVLDLGSGSAEPVSILLSWFRDRNLAPPVFVLSDLFPNRPAFHAVARRHPGRVTPVYRPVDATAVPSRISHDARTLLNTFHHFPPEAAARILADAAAARSALFIYESFPRSLKHMMATIPTMAAALIAHPFTARRQRHLKAVLTFALPVIPAMGLWDSCISAARIYDRDELEAMVRPLGHDYEWEYREIPYFPGGRAYVFFGIPEERLSMAAAA